MILIKHVTPIKILSTFLLLSFLFQSCEEKINWVTHPSGLKYRYIVKNESGTKVKERDVLILKIRYTSDNDSLLFDSRELKGMFRMQLDKPSHTGGSVEDAFSMLNVGDSIIFKVNAYNYYNLTRRMDVPGNLSPESDITFYVKLSGMQTVKDIEKEKAALYHTSYKEEEKLLEQYLKNANITTKPTLNGLYYIEKVKGMGPKAEAGHKISLHYTGKLIDGRVFYSSLERNEPLNFMLGVGLDFPGMEEGVGKMHEGGKAILIIPSTLAYGEERNGPIPPFSTLIFEVELLKVY